MQSVLKSIKIVDMAKINEEKPKKPNTVNLARLKKLMDAKTPAWGAGELAEYSSVSYDTIYSLLKGRRPNTSSEVLRKITDALGTTTDHLLGKDEEGDEQKEAPIGKLPPHVRQLADIAKRLSAIRQHELIHIARALEALEKTPLAQPENDEERSQRNYAGWEAMMSVYQRKHSPEAYEDFMDALASNFPDLAEIVGRFTPPNKRRENKG